MANTYDLIIIGSGPAGLTAAIYTSRASLNTLVLAGSPPGGQLTTTTEIENFPGFPEGIMGPVFVDNMRKQAEKFNTTIVDENVLSIKGSFKEGFTVETDGGNNFSAKALIVASGASARWLGLPSETKLRGHGVSACATCDGFFFRNKVIAVVGGGDSAMEESTFLTKFASKVYVIYRSSREEMKASKFMLEKATSNPKIKFIYNTEVVEVLGETTVTGLRLRNNITKEETINNEITGLFLAIGHTPNTSFVKDFLELDPVGYIKVTDNTHSSVEGVFVAGDVADHRYRQAITAAGAGCMAALDAEKFLAANA